MPERIVRRRAPLAGVAAGTSAFAGAAAGACKHHHDRDIPAAPASGAHGLIRLPDTAIISTGAPHGVAAHIPGGPAAGAGAHQ